MDLTSSRADPPWWPAVVAWLSAGMELRTQPGRVVVPAGEGRAVSVPAGARVRVVDLAGGQVGDVFAVSAADPAEYHSAAHTRAHTSRMFPAVGEQFVTNRRRPILMLEADTSPGRHDMLIAACDPARYAALGAAGHPSCAQNFHTALAAVGWEPAEVPQPINVFMNIPVDPHGRLRWLPALSRPGDGITFRSELDCLVVVSACPQDLVGINGMKPTPLALDVLLED